MAEPAGTQQGVQLSATADAETEEEPLLLASEPLLLEDAPLLLEAGAEGGQYDDGADNSRCHVCHINYVAEAIAVTHARAGIGCADCHGESDAHIADESWASGGNGTAPDRMFRMDEINGFCMGCHPAATLTGAVHESIVSGTDDRVCTDCHGEHRLVTRRCKWK